MKENLKSWYVTNDFKPFRCVPYLVTWKIWLVRNATIFNDRQLPAFVVIARVQALYRFFITQELPKISRIMKSVIYEEDLAGYFDGACKKEEGICGIGGTIILQDGGSISFKANGGVGTNNRAEGLVLRLLLFFSKEEQVTSFHVFGDSELWIKAMRGLSKLKICS